MALVLSKGGMGKGPRHGGGGNNDGPNDGPNDDLTELQEKHNEIDELGNEFIDKMEEILAVRKEIESCKCQHTFVQKVENFFVQLPVLCFSLLSL